MTATKEYRRNKTKDSNPFGGLNKIKMAIGVPAIVFTLVFVQASLSVKGVM